MGFFKVLGGAAIGVVTIIALPVFGPIGAITAAGAAVGAAVGAAAGGIASAGEDDDNKSSERDAYERGKAEQAAKVRDLQSKLQYAGERFGPYKKYEEFLMAAFAVGIAAAYSDGVFSGEERTELEEIVSGESYKSLPEAMRDQIQKLYGNPPSFATAMKYVKRTDRSLWDTYEAIIDMVMTSDGPMNQGESTFREAWREFKAS